MAALQRLDGRVDGRHYSFEHEGRTLEVPSVTTILGIIGKPYLVPWAVKEALKRALSHVSANLDLTQPMTEAQLAALLEASNDKGVKENARILAAAGEFGNVAHEFIEDFLNSGERTTDDGIRAKVGAYISDLQAQIETLSEGRLHVDGAGSDLFVEKVQAVLAKFYSWWDNEGFVVCATELTVYSPTALAAGTLDCLAFKGDSLCLLDWKCLLPEQTLQMADGSVVTADQVTVGDELVAWDGSGFVTDRVKDVFPGGTQPCVEVRTKYGRRLKVSANHPVWVDGEWIEAGNLQAGMPLTTWGELGEDRSDLTVEEARLLGYLVGDGSLSDKTQRAFANQDEEIVADVRAICAQLGFTVREIPGMPHNYAIGGIGSFLRKHELYCRASAEKHVPPAVMRGGEAIIRAFLTAYFDCDGHVSAETSAGTPHGRPDIVFTTMSARLAEDVQNLLARLGVNAYVWCQENKRQKEHWLVSRKPWWVKTTSRPAVLKMAGILSECRVQSKRERLACWKAAAADRPGWATDRPDAVALVTSLVDQPTIAVEMERTKTFITSGIVTHNTSNYYSTDYALQTVAYKRFYQELTGHEIGDIWVVRIGKKDAELQVVHIPEAQHAALYETFLAVRTLWQWKKDYKHGSSFAGKGITNGTSAPPPADAAPPPARKTRSERPADRKEGHMGKPLTESQRRMIAARPAL